MQHSPSLSRKGELIREWTIESTSSSSATSKTQRTRSYPTVNYDEMVTCEDGWNKIRQRDAIERYSIVVLTRTGTVLFDRSFVTSLPGFIRLLPGGLWLAICMCAQLTRDPTSLCRRHSKQIHPVRNHGILDSENDRCP